MGDMTLTGIPKLGFGLMRLPKLEDGTIDVEQVKTMVDLFLGAGQKYFDTAYVYDGGESEKAAKKALVDRYPRESYYLTTKLNASLPDLTEEELTDELMNRLQAHPDRSMAKMLVGLLPDRLIPVITGEDSGRDLKNLSLMELGQRMEELAWHITHFEVEIRGAAALSQAQVCSGGIRTEELNEHMECQRIPGLYVTGEAVDMDGACGGYNLTWAWASGFAAGRDAARR